MISEGPHDTEHWSNGWWRFSFATTGRHYFLKQKTVICNL